jgi:acyl carrier protein
MVTQTIRTQLVQALIQIAPLYDPASSTNLEDVMDSMGFTELVSFIETEWGITINGPDLTHANFGTLDALDRLVQRKVAGRG